MPKAILSAITDEFSWKLAKALPALTHFPEVKHVDLRNVDHKNIINLTPADVQRVKETLRASGELAVACVASPVGKRKVPATEQDRAEILASLGKAIEIARQFDAPFVRIFAFRREPEIAQNYEQTVALLSEFAAKADQADIFLAVENEGAYWGALPAEMDQLLRSVNSRRLTNLLDPGNHLNQNKYLLTDADVELLAPRTRFAHIKDTRQGRKGYVVVGTGDVPYRNIFLKLRATGAEPVVSLETHMGGIFRSRTSARCLANLIQILQESGYTIS